MADPSASRYVSSNLPPRILSAINGTCYRFADMVSPTPMRPKHSPSNPTSVRLLIRLRWRGAQTNYGCSDELKCERYFSHIIQQAQGGLCILELLRCQYNLDLPSHQLGQAMKHFIRIGPTARPLLGWLGQLAALDAIRRTRARHRATEGHRALPSLEA